MQPASFYLSDDNNICVLDHFVILSEIKFRNCYVLDRNDIFKGFYEGYNFGMDQIG